MILRFFYVILDKISGWRATWQCAVLHARTVHFILLTGPLLGQQRIDYMKRKVEEYGDLLNQWTNFNHDGGDERGELILLSEHDGIRF